MVGDAMSRGGVAEMALRPMASRSLQDIVSRGRRGSRRAKAIVRDGNSSHRVYTVDVQCGVLTGARRDRLGHDSRGAARKPPAEQAAAPGRSFALSSHVLRK
jgi:hypothetical protein